jgi:hypothetical protein
MNIQDNKSQEYLGSESIMKEYWVKKSFICGSNDMKKKILGMFVCMLLIVTAVPFNAQAKLSKLDDTTPPFTSCGLYGTMWEYDYYISPVTVELTAYDEESGVNYTKYKLDEGSWTEYTTPFVVSEEGNHTLIYYSVDNAGNKEDDNTVDFTIWYTPSAPTVDGPTMGRVRNTYNYTLSSTDPRGYDLYYYVDWGDNTNTDWVGPYPSGEIVNLSHSWINQSEQMMAKAKNINDSESDWSEIDIYMLNLTSSFVFGFFLISMPIEEYLFIFLFGVCIRKSFPLSIMPLVMIDSATLPTLFRGAMPVGIILGKCNATTISRLPPFAQKNVS